MRRRRRTAARPRSRRPRPRSRRPRRRLRPGARARRRSGRRRRRGDRAPAHAGSPRAGGGPRRRRERSFRAPRRCYSARGDRVVQETDQRLDVGLVPAGDAEGDAVQEARREPPDVDDVDVLPELSTGLRLGEPDAKPVAVVGRALELRDEGSGHGEGAPRSRAASRATRVLVGHRAHRIVEAAFDHQVDVAPVLRERELGEEVELAVEVVEDRAAREPDLLLEPRDGRPLVAVLREGAARALRISARRLARCSSVTFGTVPTLQNRTDVLLSRAMLKNRSLLGL